MVLVDSFLVKEFGDGIDVNEIDDGEYEFSFSSRDSFAIGEEFAAFVVDIFAELHGVRGTVSKGE